MLNANANVNAKKAKTPTYYGNNGREIQTRKIKKTPMTDKEQECNRSRKESGKELVG